ncbi:MAG: DUF177 domain-containing protein [Deltaproteobacteria bacterium]|nr:DUF177 domain-containing protein [Deltaproteobacteria bacterium]
MYIRVSDIPREGLDVIASRGKSWISGTLEGMDPYPLQTCRLISAGLFLTLEGRDIFTGGSFVAEGEALCDRCTEVFTVRLEKEFHTVLVPSDRGPSGSTNVELHEEDLEIGFYDGSGVEVTDLFWEQVALALPVKLLCGEECRGVCPRCGGNRNRGECACPEARAAGPFDLLKTLKKEKE